MSLNPLTINNLFLALMAWGAAFLVALWASLIVWTFRDIKARARDPLVRILAVLLVALLFLPGVLVYLILRPARTIDEEYQQTLEEEALLQAIEDSQLCPGCGRRIKENWLVCPGCQTKLKKNCHNCGRLMELPWNICPFCATPSPGMRRDNLTMDEALRSVPVIEDIPVEEPPEEQITEPPAATDDQ